MYLETFFVQVHNIELNNRKCFHLIGLDIEFASKFT